MAMSQPNNDLVYWSQHVGRNMQKFCKYATEAKHPLPLQSSLFEKCVQIADMTLDHQCLSVLSPCVDNEASWRAVPDWIVEYLTKSKSLVPVSGPNGGLCIPGDEDSQKAAYAEYYPLSVSQMSDANNGKALLALRIKGMISKVTYKMFSTTGRSCSAWLFFDF